MSRVTRLPRLSSSPTPFASEHKMRYPSDVREPHTPTRGEREKRGGTGGCVVCICCTFCAPYYTTRSHAHRHTPLHTLQARGRSLSTGGERARSLHGIVLSLRRRTLVVGLTSLRSWRKYGCITRPWRASMVRESSGMTVGDSGGSMSDDERFPLFWEEMRARAISHWRPTHTPNLLPKKRLSLARLHRGGMPLSLTPVYMSGRTSS